MYTNREKEISLDGTWKFCPDPMNRSGRQEWWKNERKDADQFTPCWDWNGLWDIEVPSSWNNEFKNMEWFEGQAVYVKDFTAEQPLTNEEAFLCFDGVNYKATVYLNGYYVGTYEGGYAPFQFKITPFLQKYNRLFVQVENLRSIDRVPQEIFDWFNYGGIIRPVKIIFTQNTYIQNFKVETTLSGDEVDILVRVLLSGYDQTKAVPITVTFQELNLISEKPVVPGEEYEIHFAVSRSRVRLWSPKSPYLYKINITGAGEVEDEVGLREIKTVLQDILLNGEPIELWGVCLHSEFGQYGRKEDPQTVDLMFTRCGELGANLLRLSHYPYSEAFIRRCDKEGFLVWEEVPAYWHHKVHEEKPKRLALDILMRMIKRDWNRACVAFWSVGNECAVYNEQTGETNYPYFFESVRFIKELDKSRLVTYADGGIITSGNRWNPNDGDAITFNTSWDELRMWRPSNTEEFIQLFDVISLNLYFGCYGDKRKEEEYSYIISLFGKYGKPVILSEFGAVGKLGVHNQEAQIPSEEHYNDRLEWLLRAFDLSPSVRGGTAWCLFDYKTPLHWEAFADKQCLTRMGLCNENYEPKQAFYIMQKYITKRLGN